MKILILDPRSEEWQKMCAPAQREMTEEHGGLILHIQRGAEEEAVALADFVTVVHPKIKFQEGITCGTISAGFSDDYSKAGHATFQITCTQDKPLERCWDAIGLMLLHLTRAVARTTSSPLQPAESKAMSKQPLSNNSQVRDFEERALKPYTTVDIAAIESAARVTPEAKLSAHVQEMLLRVPKTSKYSVP